MFNWYNLKQILLKQREGMLVEGGTGGGEGARSVCQDPAHLLSHPEVEYSQACVSHLSYNNNPNLA